MTRFRPRVSWAAGCYALAGLMVAIQGYCLLRYLLCPSMTDLVCANIMSVSWMAQNGHPLYHDPEAGPCYALLYGPVLYSTLGWIFRLLGPGIAAGKVAGVAWHVAAVLLIFWTLRRECKRPTAIALTTLTWAGWLGIGQFAFNQRGDPLVMFFVVLGLLGSRLRSAPTAAAVCGIALGLSIDVKLNSAAFFLPVLALLASRAGFRWTAAALGIALGTAAVPFLPGNVSFGNYLDWLRNASRHPLSLEVGTESFVYGLKTHAPLLLAAVYFGTVRPARARVLLRRGKRVLVAGLIAFLLALATSAKVGAGPQHLAPFVPMIVLAMAVLLRQTPWPAAKGGRRARLAFGILVLWLVVSVIAAERKTLRYLRRQEREAGRAVQLRREIRDIVAENPGKRIQMGCGTTRLFVLTSYHPLLVFAGHPHLLDPITFGELQLAGRPIPAATRSLLASGEFGVVLVPRGNEPFATKSFYPPGDDLFDRAFREAFLAFYEKRETTEHFDLWFHRGEYGPRAGRAGARLSRRRGFRPCGRCSGG